VLHRALRQGLGRDAMPSTPTKGRTEMQVIIRWNESVDYESTIEVDEAAMRKAGHNPAEPRDIQAFLESRAESEWFEQCSTADDFAAVTDREISEVSLTA